jgi:hypothetical protein
VSVTKKIVWRIEPTSDESGWISGVAVPLDGGLTAT